jgi:hypothetical protein
VQKTHLFYWRTFCLIYANNFIPCLSIKLLTRLFICWLLHTLHLFIEMKSLIVFIMIVFFLTFIHISVIFELWKMASEFLMNFSSWRKYIHVGSRNKKPHSSDKQDYPKKVKYYLMSYFFQGVKRQTTNV